MAKYLKLLSLEGLRALVTGAGTGLGLQMALGLAEAGADLIICGRRREPLEDCARQAAEFGAQVGTQGQVLIDRLDARRSGYGWVR